MKEVSAYLSSKLSMVAIAYLAVALLKHYYQVYQRQVLASALRKAARESEHGDFIFKDSIGNLSLHIDSL